MPWSDEELDAAFDASQASNSWSDAELDAAFDASQPEPKTPSIWENPIDALTSSDWWLTRPSGERISAEQAVTGPFMSALNTLTPGLGDEITAGGASLIDALQGEDLSTAYDQRLEQARGIQENTPLAAQLATGIPAALKTPMLNTAGSLSKLMGPAQSWMGVAGKTGALTAALAGEGALYGAGYGFGAGEGGLENRLDSSMEGAGTGAIWGGALSVPAAGLSTILEKSAPALEKASSGMKRISVGARQGDYAKTAKELNFWDITDDEIATLTKRSLDDLEAAGAFSDRADPQKLLANGLTTSKEISTNIGKAINAVDDAGTEVVAKFPKSYEYIKSGMLRPEQEKAAIKTVNQLIKKTREKGSLRYIQNQKRAYSNLWNPEDGALEGFHRALYTDLKNTIETYAPEVKGLNQELRKWKIVEPILRRNLSADEAKNWIEKAYQMVRTSGAKTVMGPAILGGMFGGPVGGALGAGLGATLAAGATPTGQAKLGSVLKSASKASAPILKGTTKAAQTGAVMTTKGPDRFVDNVLDKAEQKLMDKPKAPQVISLNRIEPSEKGVKLVKQFEGKRLEAYEDEGGVKTIGYGHTGEGVKRASITDAQAESFLKEDLKNASTTIKKAVKVSLSQSQIDALTSLVYNIGAGAFERSTLLKKLNAGDFEGAAEEFNKWIHVKGKTSAGLQKRRQAEKNLFLET